jgi:predicted DNA binding CopG/RHH family protein
MSTRDVKQTGPMVHFNIRMSPGLRAAVQRKAERLGMPVARYVRMLMERDASRR